MRGENHHKLLKGITHDSNQRKAVVKYIAKMHERKTAFIAKRYRLVNPMRQIKRLGTRGRRKTKQHVVDSWKAFGLGEFSELRSLVIMNTPFVPNTFYFKKENEYCQILNLLVNKADSDIVGFYTRVWRVKVDPDTGCLVYDRLQSAKYNLVIVSEFASKFYEVNKPIYEHHLRRNVYYSYDFGRDHKNPENDSGLMALVP